MRRPRDKHTYQRLSLTNFRLIDRIVPAGTMNGHGSPVAQSHHSLSPTRRQPRTSPSNRSSSIVSGRQLGFFALAVVALVCNVFLIQKLDQIETGGAYSRETMSTFIHGNDADDPSKPWAQVNSLQKTIHDLEVENDQMKQSLQTYIQQLLREKEEHDNETRRRIALEKKIQRDNPPSSSEKESGIVNLDIRKGELLFKDDLAESQPNTRRRIRADAKVSSFAEALNHSTPLPDAIPLDYTTYPDPAGYSKKSSVDYHACCGLGHRLSRMSDANYVAQRLNLGLRSFWGFCGNLEVFYYLFGPQRVNMLANVTDTGNYLRISKSFCEASPLSILTDSYIANIHRSTAIYRQ